VFSKKFAVKYIPPPLLRARDNKFVDTARKREPTYPDDWTRFRRIAAEKRWGNLHSYTGLVRRADPALPLANLHDARFVGSGAGAWNLTRYRAGTVNGQAVFEKIYLKNSLSWKKLMWAYYDVLPKLKKSIQTPPILWHAGGDWLEVAYFPLLTDTRQSPTERIVSVAVDLQKAVSGFRWLRNDPSIHDFRLDPIYSTHRERLQKVLIRAGRNPNLVELVENFFQHPGTPYRFAHADLNPENVLYDGTIVDLDLCGYYPAGYEYGKCIVDGPRINSMAEMEELVDQELSLTSWQEKAAVYFFSAVFFGTASPESPRAVKDDFILSLLNRAIDLISRTKGSGSWGK
jgi:hypothetical protein